MLRITTTPPAHSVDDVPTWIWQSDPAWDFERIRAEYDKLGPAASMHPVSMYLSGEHRYSLTALHTIPELIRAEDGPATATVEHWLRKSVKPTRFEMCSLSARDWATADAARERVGWYEFARRGLVRICDAIGEDGKPSVIKPPREDDGAIYDLFFDGMSREHRAMLDDLGYAIYRLSKNEVSRVEGKP